MAGPLVRITCPLCGSAERMELSSPMRFWADRFLSHPSTDTGTADALATASVCPNCNRPFAIILVSNGTFPSRIYSTNSINQVDELIEEVQVLTIPSSLSIQTFKALPKVVAENFAYVQEDAQRKRNPAGIMSQARACLDVALKALGQETGGRKTRIQNLADEGVITSAIAAWAQNLWEEGSDAVHDLNATIDRAVEHVEFLKLFFEVAFELPARIAAQPHAPTDLTTAADAPPL